jgi:hypothetical protein
MIASCEGSDGLVLVEACLARSPADATRLFTSLGLMSTLERLVTFRSRELSVNSLRAAAVCTLHHLRYSPTSLVSSLHVTALLARYIYIEGNAYFSVSLFLYGRCLATDVGHRHHLSREAHKHELPDELVVPILNAANAVLQRIGTDQTGSERTSRTLQYSLHACT